MPWHLSRLSASILEEAGGHATPAEASAELPASFNSPDHHARFNPLEGDLIARTDPRLLAKRLRNHNLALGADTLSHTY